MDKSSRVIRNRRDIIKILERKPRFNINLEEEKFKAIPLKKKEGKVVHSLRSTQYSKYSTLRLS